MALAALQHHDATWFVERTSDPRAPDSAVIALVRGLREGLDHADLALRRPILSADEPTALERAVVRVAAKRVRGPSPITLPVDAVDVGAWADAALARAIASVDCTPLEEALAALPPREGPQRLRDRPVIATLVDRAGRTLLTARNRSGRNRTLHAEVVLAHAWWARERRSFPEGARVLVSLQPCRMCAATLVHLADPGGLQVRYLHADPGPLARCTALDRAGWVAPLERTVGEGVSGG